jgi:hypothetical protein
MIVNRTRTPRKGVASLELVLIFPLMLFCAAGVMYAGRAGLARATVSINVRRTVFLDREKAESKSPLSVFEDVTESRSSVETGRPFKTWIKGPKTPIARSKSTTLTGEWNHYSVQFDPDRGFLTPHIKVLGRFIGGTGLSSGLEKVMGGFGKVLEFVLTNKLVIDIGKAANLVLDGGAFWLKWTLLPLLQVAEYAVKLANLNPFVSLGALDDAIDGFQTSVQSLIDATDELPGDWNFGELSQLVDYFN